MALTLTMIIGASEDRFSGVSLSGLVILKGREESGRKETSFVLHTTRCFALTQHDAGQLYHRSATDPANIKITIGRTDLGIRRN